MRISRVAWLVAWGLAGAALMVAAMAWRCRTTVASVAVRSPTVYVSGQITPRHIVLWTWRTVELDPFHESWHRLTPVGIGPVSFASSPGL